MKTIIIICIIVACWLPIVSIWLLCKVNSKSKYKPTLKLKNKIQKSKKWYNPLSGKINKYGKS